MKSTETQDEQPLTSLAKIVSREEWQRARDRFLSAAPSSAKLGVLRASALNLLLRGGL